MDVRILTLFFLMVLGGSQADGWAESRRLKIYGTVTEVADASDILGGSISSGMQFTGDWVYDPTAVDAAEIFENYGLYSQLSEEGNRFEVRFPSLTLSTSLKEGYAIEVINDIPDTSDDPTQITGLGDSLFVLEHLGSEIEVVPGFVGSLYFSMAWQDASGDAFSSDSLLDFSPFEHFDNRTLRVTAVSCSAVIDGPCPAFDLTARIDSVVAVPEPATTVYCFSSLIAMAMLTRSGLMTANTTSA